MKKKARIECVDCWRGYKPHIPCFKKGTMYKGMESNKSYTIEELGL